MKIVTFNGWDLYPGRMIELANPAIEWRIRKVGRDWYVLKWTNGKWCPWVDFSTWETAMLYLDRRLRYQYGNRRPADDPA